MALTKAQQRRQTIGPVPTSDPDLDTDAEEAPPPGGNISTERLKSFVERIERLEEEKRTLADDIKEVKKEAKGSGFDVKVIAYIIKLRRMDKDDLDEFDTQVDIYKRALGMIP